MGSKEGFIVGKIKYNSWISEYKQPFGAVETGTEVRFQLDCQVPEVQAVFLMIHKDFGKDFQVEMSMVHPTRYQATFKLTEDSGLYFYHFKIQYRLDDKNETLYYGNNEACLGGPGAVYYAVEEIKEYQLTSYLYDDPAPDWYQKGVAYQIFVDRFYNGNASGLVSSTKKNSFLYASPEDRPMYIKDEAGDIIRWEFFGGNLKGVIKKLSYLADLGITILYLNPIFEARSNHKYDTGNFLKIDPMFGNEDIFKELIEKANEFGIHIILDGVFNHVGADSRYFNRYGNYEDIGAYQSPTSRYADWFTFEHFPDEYESWWGIKDLPKLNKENPKVQEFIYAADDSVVQKWSKMGIGGWRIDVADEISDLFLTGIRTALEQTVAEPVLIGEVWEDASNKMAYGERRHYIEGGSLHGVMNYPFRKTIIDFLNQTISAKEAASQAMQLKENYPPEVLKNNLNNIGSHDTVRILTALQLDKLKLQQALTLLFVLPGVPCLYYGDEAGVEGGDDPDNRRMFPWGFENQTLLTFIRERIALRKSVRALQDGELFAFSTEQILGLVRYLSEEEYVLILINSTADEQIFEAENAISYSSFKLQHFLEKGNLTFLNIPAQGVRIIEKCPSSTTQDESCE